MKKMLLVAAAVAGAAVGVIMLKRRGEAEAVGDSVGAWAGSVSDSGP